MSMRHRQAFLRCTLAVSASLLALSACGETPAASNDAVVVRDSAGVAMVTNYRAQWPEGGGWQIDSVPRLSLGGAEADTNQHWGYIEAAARLGDGRIVLTESGQLRWFDANGVHLRTIAAGDGPGEFRRAAALHVLPGDSLRVHDGRGLKFAVFAPDGSLAYERHTDTEKLRALGRWTECWNTYLPDASRLLCQADTSIPVSATNRPNRRLASGLTSPGPGLLRQLHRVWLVTPALDRAFPLGVGAGIEQFGVDVGGRTQYASHPFYSRSIKAAGGNPMRIATALNPDYRIELWTPDGVLERVIMRHGARRTPRKEELADVPEALRSEVFGDDQVLIDRVIAEVPTPDSMPAMLNVSFTSRGELLVMREGHLPSHTHAVYDVFDREGVWQGTLRVKGPMSIVDVSDDSILTFRENERGVMLVEVYGYRR
jgi:hypothetical protein